MVSIYCSHCIVVFPSINALHSHLKKQVPNGSYIFDFSSQTGYPNDKPHPFIDLSEIRKPKEFKLRFKSIKEETGKYKKIKSIHKKDKQNAENNSTTLNIKKENELESITVDNQVGDSDIKIPVDESQSRPNSNVEHLENLQSDDIHCSHVKNDTQDDDCGNDEDDGNNDDAENGETFDIEIDTFDDFGVEIPKSDNYENDKEHNVHNDEGNTESVDAGFDDAMKPVVKEENGIESESESDGNQRQTRYKKRSKTAQLKAKLKLKELGFEFRYEGRKKYLKCEVCGKNKEQYKLVDHIESVHSDEILSQRLLQKLRELRSILQKRKVPKVKKVKKEKKKEKDSDSDFVPSGGEEDDECVKKKRKRRSTIPPGFTKISSGQRHTSKKKTFIECRLCGMFVQNARAKRHEKFHYTKAGKKMFQPENLAACPTCDRKLLKANLATHKCFLIKPKVEVEQPTKEERMINHKQKRKEYTSSKSPCYVCGILVKRSTMKKHVLIHSDVKPFECEVCKKRYVISSQLKKHTVEAHGERRFQCDKCPKAFYQNQGLKDHMITHSDVRPHVCETCGQAFRRKKALVCHLYVHTEKLPRFACNQCGKAFMRNTNLQAHIKSVHEILRDWICSWPDCAKRFNTSPVLRRHMLIHVGEKPIKCNQCDAGFTQRPELKFHLKRKHNSDKMPPPTFVSPFSGLPHAIIKNPLSKEGDTVDRLKTIFYPSMDDHPFKNLVIEYRDSAVLYQFYTPNSDNPDPSTNSGNSNPSNPVYSDPLTNPGNPGPKFENAMNYSSNPDNSSENLVDNGEARETLKETSLEYSQEQMEPIQFTSHGLEAQLQHSQPMEFTDTAPVAMETLYTSTETTTTVTTEGMFINSQVSEPANSQLSYEIEDVPTLAAPTTTIESISLDQPIESSHMTSSTSAEYQQLLSSPSIPVSSLMKSEPELGPSHEHSWGQFE